MYEKIVNDESIMQIKDKYRCISINQRINYLEFKANTLQSEIFTELRKYLTSGTYNMACMGRFGVAEEVLYVRVKPTYYEFCNVKRDVVLNISNANVGITADFQCMLISYATPAN